MESAIKSLYERSPQGERLLRLIWEEASKLGGRKIKIMNFCGTHEWTITHYGIRSVMPENVELVAGPGCPVCVTPGHYVDLLVRLSMEGYTILTYGDSFKLPGTSLRRPRSLYDARAAGGRVEVVYSFADALKRASKRRGERFVFFAVGFETTMPSTSVPLYMGKIPENLLILSAYRLTPPVMEFLLREHPEVELSGVIAPGHVSSVIGSEAWRFLADEYRVPTVVAGFEPLDVLLAILLILRMVRESRPRLLNEYVRSVRPEGNALAKKIMWEVYEPSDSYWRGIGVIPKSGARHRGRYLKHDLLHELGIEDRPAEDKPPGCKCPEVTLGLATPLDCPLFMRACTPSNPYGPCMVSSEGTCRIWAESMPALRAGGLRF